MRTYTKPALLFLIMTIALWIEKASAGVVSWSDTLKGSSITAGALYSVHEDVFDSTNSSWNSGFHTKNNWSLISFGLDNFNSKCIGSSFSCMVTVDIHYLDSNRTAHNTSHTFEITYNPATGASYKDKDLFKIPGAVYTRVTVTSISASGISLASIQSKLELETVVLVERYYYFATTDVTSSLSSSYQSVSGDLEVTWSPIVGAETYDLEWTYVNDYDGTITSGTPNYLSASNVYYDFPHNCSRVRISSTSFNIPIVYEHGYLLYRVRGVGRSGTNYTENVPMAWSSVADQGAVSGFTSGHKYAITSTVMESDQKNWQIAMNFAEEGKIKSMVTFYDGSQRKRQMVTRLNTIQKAMIGETIYDSAGRAAIDILPVPTNSPQLKYYYNFNRNTSGNPYSHVDFGPVSGSCTPVAGPMDTTSGASKYYSHNNGDSSLQQAYLPDAKRYPFAQTEYTTDNTGRIRAKSGLGTDHKLGSGHETKYFYGTPYQEELDRLFANEVGYSVHYQKNMIIDPNGQIAVTYKDAKGNVIATALAGDGPSNLTALSSASSNSLTVDLLGNNEVTTDSTAIVSKYTMIVSSAGIHKFTYAMGGAKTSTLNCRAMQTCHTCKYNLTISITNGCGDSIYGLKKAIGTIDTNGVTCSGAGARFNSNHDLPDSINIYLSVGSYTLTKTLAVDMDAIDTMVNKYVNDPRDTCIHSLQYFLDKEMANIDSTNCNIGCSDCQTKLGSYDRYSDPESEFYLSPAQYQQLLANCNSPCGKDTLTNPCDISYQAMLMDVSPDGQYGQYRDTINGTFNASIYPLSVYNTTASNKLPKGTSANWKNPSGNYLEDNGAPSYIIIAPDGTPAHDGTHEETLPTGEIAVRPQYLTNLTDFIANWHASWASSLVPFHPEYGYAAWCNTISSSNTYDEQMQHTDAFASAESSFFTGTSNIPVTTGNYASAISDMVDKDPFFKGVGSGSKLAMIADMTNYTTGGATTYNIFQVARMGAICPNANTASDISTCLTSPYFGFGSTADKDAEWKMLRSLYYSLKQKYVAQERNTAAIAGRYYNGCIGNKNFDPSKYGFEPVPYAANTGYFDSRQPCYMGNVALYANKIIRYPTADDILKIPGVDDLYGDKSVVLPMLQSYAASQLNGVCGQCPGEIDLQYLLNDLAGQKLLDNTDTLNDFPEFGMGIRKIFAGSDTFLDYYWIPGSSSSTSLQVNISQDSGLCCNITFNTQGDTVVWDSIKSICCLHEVPYSSPEQFTFIATMNDGRRVNITAESGCITMGCAPAVQCRAAQQATDLLRLFNTLFTNSDWTSTTSLTSAPYDSIMTDLLKSFITPNGNLHWVKRDSLDLGFVNVGAGDTCLFSFDKPSGLGWNAISRFESLMPDPSYLDTSGSSSHFILTALKTDGTFAEIKGTSGCMTIGECGYPNMACTYPMEVGDSTRNSLLELLDSLAHHDKLYTTSAYNIDSFAGFNTQLKSIIGGSSRSWQSGADSMLTFKAWINNGACYDSLTFTCADSAFNFRDITGFTNLVAVPIKYTNALTYTFTIDAITDGGNVTLHGIIGHNSDSIIAPCFQIANCTSCPYNVLSYTPIGDSVPRPAPSGACADPLCTGVGNNSVTIPYSNPCATNLKNIANNNAKEKYAAYIDSLKKAMRRVFIAQCLQAVDTFNVTFTEKEFHYTLYYYDQSNKLIKTVPPAGVVPITSGTTLANIKAYRKNNGLTRQYTNHTLCTKYRYNSLDELTFQNTPDAGDDSFYYDVLGRMVASQNARQAASNIRYSYTIYDPQGRIVEVGEIVKTNLREAIARDSTSWASWISSGTRQEITKTYYDVPKNSTINGYFANGQQFLRTRVATMTYQDVAGSAYDYATHYSYDVHGNVSDMIQEYPALHYLGQDLKRISYDYDLISSKVNYVYYQSGQADRLIHKYEYDADNRLVNVLTSRDSMVWENDASQFYYDHGPLGREELGDNKVQGIDYAYTIQGWIKGVNSSTLSAKRDMGNDGYTISGPYSNLHKKVARDAYGYTLSYFSGDYTSITSNAKFEASLPGSGLNAASPDLFNGNIRNMVTAVGKLMPTGLSQGTAYTYDQLNRILSMDAYNNIDSANDKWNTGTTPMNDYKCRYTYDANGNILGLLRKGTTADGNHLDMDSLTYHYTSSTNRLDYVHDTVRAANYKTDIDDESSGNYAYDETGNLKQDTKGEIGSITWTAYGKIKKIVRTTGSTKPNLLFYYAPDGNRIAKIAQYGTDPSKWVSTYYVRDATGNIMAVYKRTVGKPGAGDRYLDSLNLSELNIYGSKRIGLIKADTTVVWLDYNGSLNNTNGMGTPSVTNNSYYQAAPTANFSRYLGKKRYELSNHLGNVLAVISDKKICNPPAGYDTALYYTAEVITATDYYPFGSPMPGRTYNVDSAAGNDSVVSDTCLTCNRLKNLLQAYSGSLLDSNGLTVYMNLTLGVQQTVGTYMYAIRSCNILRDSLYFLASKKQYVSYPKKNQYVIGHSNFTIEAWVSSSDGGNTGQAILSNQAYFSSPYLYFPGILSYLYNHRLYLSFGEKVNGAPTYPYRAVDAYCSYPNDTKWHHVVLERTGTGNNYTDVKIWIDNVSQTIHAETDNTNLVSGNIDSSGEQLDMKVGTRVGSYPPTPQFFDGSIRNVRLYKRALGAAEIDSNYHRCSQQPKDTSNLLLWAGIDQAGLTVPDKSVYHNTGYLINFPAPGSWGARTDSVCEHTDTLCSTPVTDVHYDTCVTCANINSAMGSYHGSLSDTSAITAHIDSVFNFTKTQADIKAAFYKCKLGNADTLYFDGVSGGGRYVDFGNNAQYKVGTGAFTLEAWVNSTQNDTSQVIMSDQKQYVYSGTFRRFPGFNFNLWNNRLYFYIGDGNNAPSGMAYRANALYCPMPSPEINKWHHVVAVRPAGSKKWSDITLYIDGMPQITSPDVDNSDLQSANIDSLAVESMKVGSRTGSYRPNYFNGSIREARMYKRALNWDEIISNYNNGCVSKPWDTISLVLWAPLDEGTGSTVSDRSHYHATGIITNPGSGYWGSSSSYCYLNTPVLCETHTRHFANNAALHKVQTVYRYGFNGKEKDDETYGEGDDYDFGARIYDPRLGRWLNVDPQARKYPEESNYLFTSDNPIVYIDNDGKDRYIYFTVIDKNGRSFTFLNIVKNKYDVTTSITAPQENQLQPNYYISDVRQTIVFDVRKPKGNQLSSSEDIQPNTTKSVGLTDYLDAKYTRVGVGSRGGWVLQSDFSESGEGDKENRTTATDITFHNVDGIAAIDAASQELKHAFGEEDPLELASQLKDQFDNLVKLLKNADENAEKNKKEAENNKENTSTSQNNTQDSCTYCTTVGKNLSQSEGGHHPNEAVVKVKKHENK